jgi:hypothetical protein
MYGGCGGRRRCTPARYAIIVRVVDLTQRELDEGRETIRRWPDHHVRELVTLPKDERALIVLAAGLLNLAPGAPTDRDILELP